MNTFDRFRLLELVDFSHKRLSSFFLKLSIVETTSCSIVKAIVEHVLVYAWLESKFVQVCRWILGLIIKGSHKALFVALLHCEMPCVRIFIFCICAENLMRSDIHRAWWNDRKVAILWPMHWKQVVWTLICLLFALANGLFAIVFLESTKFILKKAILSQRRVFLPVILAAYIFLITHVMLLLNSSLHSLRILAYFLNDIDCNMGRFSCLRSLVSWRF